MPLSESKQYKTTKGFYLSSAVWMVAGTLAGLIGAVELVAPDLLGNIPWLVFGRIRQVHTTLVMFGFVGSGLLGGAHYLVPTLVRTPLFSEWIGRATVWLWNLALTAGVITLSMGHTQNREYAELIWPIDMGVLLVLGLIFYNLIQTLRHR
ncbi:MAG: cbb3-type cytochrome c oxidase subunit I, partial [Desulfatiglandales bacterium]